MTEATRRRLECLRLVLGFCEECARAIIDPPKAKQGWLNNAHAVREVIETLEAIEELREDEGDCVQITSDNADFNVQPNCLIVCSGEWTAWADIDFTGETILACLQSAVSRRREVESDDKRKELGDDPL